MKRPATLLTHVVRVCRDHALWERGDLLLCACSGGPDSTALLHALAVKAAEIGHRVAAVGIDHGLRSDAQKELAVVEGVADRLGVPFVVRTLAVAPGSNLQARARSARHAALQATATELGATHIALGHTADDRAETVLIRLLRGAGPAGLAVMPLGSPGVGGDTPIIRPLGTCRRADVNAHLDRHELPHAHDPTNDDTRFLRARVRHELLPLMEALSPGVVATLNQLADALAADDPLSTTLAGLSRAQRQALEHALRTRRGGTTIRLRGGRDLRLTFVDREHPEPGDQPDDQLERRTGSPRKPEASD